MFDYILRYFLKDFFNYCHKEKNDTENDINDLLFIKQKKEEEEEEPVINAELRSKL